MKAEELRSKTPDQLRDSLVQLKKEAFNLRFQQATNQLENTARMRAVRRDGDEIDVLDTREVRRELEHDQIVVGAGGAVDVAAGGGPVAADHAAISFHAIEQGRTESAVHPGS